MLGELLRQLRQQHQLTLKQLAQQYQRNKGQGSIDSPLLSRYENGFYQLSKDRLIDLLVKGMNYDPKKAAQIISAHIVAVEQKNLPSLKVAENSTVMIPVFDSIKAVFQKANAKHIVDYASQPQQIGEKSRDLAYARVKDESQTLLVQGADTVLITTRVGSLRQGSLYVFPKGKGYQISDGSDTSSRPVGKVIQIVRDLI